MNVPDAPGLTALCLVVSFVYGALFGSFFNVCIYRLPLKMSIGRPARSFCFSCGSPVRWSDNIPLVSYWTLGGRCRDCGAPFSIRYFLVELLTACLFAAVFWVQRYSFAVPIYWIFTGFLIIATFTDLDHWIILPSISIGGTATGLVLALLIPWLPGATLTSLDATAIARHWDKELSAIAFGSADSAPLGGVHAYAVAVAGPAPVGVWWGPFVNALVGAVFGFALLWTIGLIGRLIFRKDAMGGGDLRLFACVGAFLGWGNCLWTLFAACFVGAIVGSLLILIDKLRAARHAAAHDNAELDALARELRGAGGAGAADAETAAYDLERDIAASTPTSGLHHVEFGPYIALAAYAVMLFHRHTAELTAQLVDALRFIVYGEL